MIEVRRLTGVALDGALDDVARLRLSVFREWPYLYDGSLEYERTYLETYRQSAPSVLVGAFDGPKLVGAATGTLLQDHAEDFALAFANSGLAINNIFYCAESVLLPAYRGQGVGHRFFDERESHARGLGCTSASFCAVVRPHTHTLRPQDYRPLDGFWRKRGYEKLDGVIAHFRWRDVDQPEETEKPLQFWLRRL